MKSYSIARILVALLVCYPSNSQIIHGPKFIKSKADSVFTDPRRCFGLGTVDVNNDGYPDLFFNNMTTRCDLLINNRHGGFIRVNDAPMVKDTGWATGQCWADYDGDGNIDLLVTYQDYSGTRLYRNSGNGKFERVTIQGLTTDKGPSFHPVWSDINNDGILDVLIANNTYFGDKSSTRFFVYYGEGKGQYLGDTSNDLADLHVSSSSSNFADYDQDGDADLFVTTWGNGVFLMKNNGNGTFTKITKGFEGLSGNFITCSWVDYDTDGDLDVFVTKGHPDKDTCVLFQNLGNDVFKKVNSSALYISGKFWNSGWGDFDNDGDLDVCMSDLLNKTYLFENDGKGNFMQTENNVIVTDTSAGFACANLWVDYNLDGQLDLVLADIKNGHSPIIENKGNSNHWMEFVCTGDINNRSAIGTVIKVLAVINGKEVWQIRQVASVEAFRTVNLTLHFGLGDATVAKKVIITWPMGKTDVMKNLAADKILKISKK